MITTVTLNTSVDKLYLVEKLEDYTVMRVKKVSNTAGGKGLNVSKVAYLLGEKVSALGFAGGFNGSYVSSLLEAQGIRAGFTRIQAETRSCINIRELSTGRHTEFLEPGAPVTHAECDEFLSGYRETLPNSQVVTISGSVPAGVEVDFYGKLVSLAKQGGIPVIVDTSGALLAETVKGPYRELVSTLIDFWHHVRLEPPVIQVSNKKTKEQLDKAGFRFEIPEPGRLLSGFTLQDSWVGKGE